MRPLRKMVYTFIVLSVLFLAGCGESSQPTSPPPTLVPKFAYVTNNNPPSISAFRVDASLGALTSVPGSPFAAPDSLISIANDPKGKFVYTTNYGLSLFGNFIGSISGYSIDSNSGALTAIVGSPFPTGTNPGAVAVHASGNFLYVTNTIESHLFYSGSISAYSIDASTGGLSEIAGSPFQAGQLPVSLAQDPSGKFLYAADLEGDQVLAYSIDQLSGLLAPIPGSPFASPSPSSIAVDPVGDFLFVANVNDNTVSAYAINHESGALSAVSGSPFGGAGPNPVRLTVDPTGKFLYVANYTGASVSGYQIDSRGELTSISGSPFPVGQPVESIAVDPSGKFVYVIGASSGQVFGFTIGTEGSLTPMPASPFGLNGDSPHAIVVIGMSQ